MSLKFNSSFNTNTPYNNPAYRQMSEALARLQQGKRINTAKANVAPPTNNGAANRSGDSVVISQEALAKARQAALAQQNNPPSIDDAPQNQTFPYDASILTQGYSANSSIYLTGAPSVEAPPDTSQTETTEETPEETTETNAPALADTAQLGSVKITNVRETVDENGNRTGATGESDLSQYGMGKVAVDLQLEGDKVIGATSQKDKYEIDVGGNSFTIEAQNGGDLLTVDEQGGITIEGQASATIGDRQIDISDASISISKDAQNNDVVSIQGKYGSPGSQTQVSVDYNSSGVVTAEVSSEALTELAPGFDKVTDFLSRVGVDVSTETGAKISYNKNEGSMAFDAFGISGSYNQTTGDVSIGGLSVGAGISVSLNDLTVNTKTGAASGSVSAGVGVGVGDIGIGIDLAGFDFAYDPTSGDITLSGTQGIAAANLQVTAKLSRGSNGQYGLKSVEFKANIDDRLARDVAAGLNSAFEQGTQLGKDAVAEINRVSANGRQAVEDFANGLQQAGGRMSDFLEQAQRFSGTQLNQFLSTASSAGNQFESFLNRTADMADANVNNFLSAASKAGDQLGNLLSTAGKLTDANLSNFLSAASSKGKSFIGDFTSMLNDVNKISGGVVNLSVSKSGGISGRINVPGAGSMDVSFSRENGNLKAKGNLNLGGFAFSNAEVTFDRNGIISGVQGGAKLSTPSFRVLGKKIGSQSVSFGLELDRSGNVVAKGKLSVNLGFLGRHGAQFTIGTKGFSMKTF